MSSSYAPASRIQISVGCMPNILPPPIFAAILASSDIASLWIRGQLQDCVRKLLKALKSCNTWRAVLLFNTWFSILPLVQPGIQNCLKPLPLNLSTNNVHKCQEARQNKMKAVLKKSTLRLVLKIPIASHPRLPVLRNGLPVDSPQWVTTFKRPYLHFYTPYRAMQLVQIVGKNSRVDFPKKYFPSISTAKVKAIVQFRSKLFISKSVGKIFLQLKLHGNSWPRCGSLTLVPINRISRYQFWLIYIRCMWFHFRIGRNGIRPWLSKHKLPFLIINELIFNQHFLIRPPM